MPFFAYAAAHIDMIGATNVAPAPLSDDGRARERLDGFGVVRPQRR